MKTKLLKLSCLALVLFTFFGCNDCSKCEKEIEDTKKELENTQKEFNLIQSEIKALDSINIDTETEYSSFFLPVENFCLHKEAVTKNQYYNTITGKASINIPVPNDHTFDKKSYDSKTNTVTYYFKGTNYDKDNYIFPDTLSNLSQDRGAELYVVVVFDFVNDKCENTSQRRKYKNSTVKGQPIPGIMKTDSINSK